MTLRTLINTCLRACLLLLIVGGLPSQAQQEKYPFELAGSSEPLKLSTSAENKVQVWNNTTRPLTLNVALLDEPTQGGESLSSVVELVTKVLAVDPAAPATIILRGKPNASKPGTPLTGHLVVSDGNSDTVRRKSLVLAPAKTSQTKLISPVSTFKAKVYYYPWSYRTGDEAKELKILDVPVPLDEKLDAQEVDEKFKDDKSVALLTDKEDGETAVLEYQHTKADLPGDTTGIVLGLKGRGAPGEYTGKLSEIKTDEDKPLTITVISAHYWFFAALACFIGILLYYLMQWYLNVLRKVWELKEQEAQLGVAFGEAKENYEKTADGKEYEKDTIEPDFKKQRAALLKKINGLMFRNFIKLDENSDAYKGVIKQLGEMDETARRWSAFAEKKLNPLDDLLRKSESDFKLRPLDETLTGAEPRIAMKAREVIAARGNPMTIAEFNGRLAKADELLPRLSAWQNLNAKAAKIWHMLDAITKTPGFKESDPLRKDEIETDKEDTFKIWRTLWAAESFDPQGLEGDLFELENSLAIHLGQSAKGGPAQPAATVKIEVDKAFLPEESPAARIVRNLIRKRISLDFFYLILVTVVAVYTGLNTFYFNKPFGTLRDYLDALVWGFGTKALIDLVTGAINKFLPTAIR
ncbi:MAG TPA: hypothetical protein VKA70_15335 [Blastocatellia bacterium]|nr:hypothetical protein [Blastocatellia bacterium]